uniref:Uncharacterized protein n=1 Tax=viral metagenome TaxID=1070528 RepID=A0A6M3XZ74_9ZZZZ
MNQYFDTGLITIDGDTDELEFEIFDIIKRNAKNLYVTNYGSNKMFVKTYTYEKKSRRLWPTVELWIRPRQTKCFHNVSKILIGKTSIGNEYHITEFKHIPVKIEDVRADTDGLMKISFAENVPEIEIINENAQDLVIRISHNESDVSNDKHIVPGDMITFYDIKRIEVVKG